VIVSTRCWYYVCHPIERHQGTISVAKGFVSTQCLHYVLHAFEPHQGTISEAEGLSQRNVCIVFYMRLGDTISETEGLS